MVAKLWIVIVNYRTAALAVDCLRSLADQIGELSGMHVVVTDNASGDGSVELLSSTIEGNQWSRWVSLLPLPLNGGFSYGNNAGIRLALEAGADYVMLLNPDTVVREGAIKALLDFMESAPKVGVAGSLLENADGSVDSSAHRVPTPLGELEAGARLGVLSRLLRNHMISIAPAQAPHACDWVSGAAMIIRCQALQQTGLMDEDYFLYYEEVDLCCRIRRAGWSVWYVPASRVLHLEGASTGIQRGGKRRARYWFDSRRRFFVKHQGAFSLFLADILWSFGRTTLLARRALHLGGGSLASDPKWFMFDLIRGDLKAFFNGQLFSISREK